MDYPTELIEKGIEGTVVYQFTITEEGEFENPVIKESAHPELDKLALVIIEKMRYHILPAKKNRQRIASEYTLPIRFNIDEYQSYIKKCEENEEERKHIFYHNESVAIFAGGDQALLDHINARKRYPDKLKGSGIQERVICNFTVDRLGRVQNAEVIKQSHPEFGKEALRLINNLPDWYPGSFNCKFRDMRYTVPIHFQEEE